MKKKYTVAEDGFVGYWHPADGHTGKAIIVFPGSGADYELTRKGSEFLRSAGWSCLLVAFAGWDGLPEDPVLAPVEYAEKAINSLRQPGRGGREHSGVCKPSRVPFRGGRILHPEGVG